MQRFKYDHKSGEMVEIQKDEGIIRNVDNIADPQDPSEQARKFLYHKECTDTPCIKRLVGEFGLQTIKESWGI